MDWYELADNLIYLKKIVAKGYLDYHEATKAVQKLVDEYRNQPQEAQRGR